MDGRSQFTRIRTVASLGLAVIVFVLSITGCSDDRTASARKTEDSLADVEAVAMVEMETGWEVSVTLRHADSGWDHFADWWRITDASGSELARRVLRHPHMNEQPFTRSLQGIEFPPDIRRLVVGAHCKVHGHGGNSVQVDLLLDKGPGFTVSRQRDGGQ